MIAQCSGARPFPAHESKSPASMDINYHRQHDDHGHTQEINGPDLHQKLQSDLLPSDVSGKKAFKTVFTMLPKYSPCYPKGPFLPPCLPLSTTAFPMQSQLKSLPEASHISHDLRSIHSWI